MDPDGDALTYSATGLPPGLSINAAGVISGTLGYTAAATYTPTVRVTDAKGASASTSFTWTVTDLNRPPVLAPVGNKTVVAGTLLTFTLSASDPDGGLLTFGATGSPAGASLNASTGAFSWTPGAAQVGSYSVPFRVTDPGGLSASEMITITVTAGTAQNRDPICTTARPSMAEIWPPNHRMVAISILGITDPDGDPVTTAISRILQDEPTNTQGDGSTAVDGAGVGTPVAWVRAERTGTPRVPGNGRVYEIQFQATDGRGGSCTGAVMVGVPHDQGHGPAIDDGIRYDSTVAGGGR